MGSEASKALSRRLSIPAFRERYFVGSAIDVGAGADGLSKQLAHWPALMDVRDWDLPDGDAQLLESIADESVDVLHSSHCLEHMRDPTVAVKHWVRVLKPGGYLVIMVPDEDMYEQGIFPSTFNPDHRWSFSPWKVKSWSPVSIAIPLLLTAVGDTVELLRLEQIQDDYDWTAPRVDQTGGRAAAAIEIVLRKRHATELLFGGRVGRAR